MIEWHSLHERDAPKSMEIVVHIANTSRERLRLPTYILVHRLFVVDNDADVGKTSNVGQPFHRLGVFRNAHQISPHTVTTILHE